MTGDCSLVTVQTQARYGLEGVTELDQTRKTNNQQETCVTDENNGRTETDYRTGFSPETENVVRGETHQDQLENEGEQTQARHGLEGVTELPRTRKTNNQKESSVTVENGPETENVVQVGNPQDQLENEEGQSQSQQELEGVTELARTRKTNNQQETCVTVENGPGTENVVRVGNPQDQLENEEGQSQSPQSLEGVTELARTSYTDNQIESSVTRSSRSIPADSPLRKRRANEIPAEAVEECDRQWIAEQLKSCQTIENVRFWWYEVGLTPEHLQLGWDLLTNEVKQRLRLLFSQMKALEMSQT